MDKKPGGFLQRIARMPKAIKSAAQAIPIIGALAGNPAEAREQPIPQATIMPSGDALIIEAQRQRVEMLDRQGKLKMSKEEYEKYFKKGEIKQTDGDNCYALASLDAIQHSPQAEAMIRASMKKNPDGSWEVGMPLMNDDGKIITVSPKEMQPQINPDYLKDDRTYPGNIDYRKTIDPVDAPEGIRALESALIKEKFGTDGNGNVNRNMAGGGQPLLTMDQLVGDNFIKTWIGGHVKELELSDGKRVRVPARFSEAAPKIQTKLDGFLDKFNPDTDIAAAGTTQEPILDVNHTSLQNAHAYSIRKTDPNNKTITLANPQDTSETISLTYDQFKKNFTSIHAIRPDHTEILKNLRNLLKGKDIFEDRRFQEPHHSSLENPQSQNAATADSQQHSMTGYGQNNRALLGAQNSPDKKQRQDAVQTVVPPTDLPKKSLGIQPPNPRSTPPSIAESQINTSFTTQQFIIETPGSQDVHDEVTQTYTQPSPSFTPARVLNRQFISRPLGGSNGSSNSGKSRSHDKMARMLKTQLGRRAVLLAAQAASSNIFAIGVILGIFLLIFIINIFLISMVGTGSAEEKKVSGTGGSCAPVTYKGTEDTLTDSEARVQLAEAGLDADNIKAGVSFEGIRQNTICGIINFKNESGLNDIVITSGTDSNHSTRGTQTHQNGWKLDIRSTNANVSNYIISSFIKGVTRKDGAVSYTDQRTGNVYYFESTIVDKVTGKVRRTEHWDIAFIGSNCMTQKPGEVVQAPQQNAPACEAPAQQVPENSVLSVQDCTEKWSADINSNPYKQNFGDSNCDFDQTALYKLLTELDPDQADKWFNVVIKKESGFRPNYYSKSPSGNDERWGLFQMRNGLSNPLDKGDSGWEQQVTNAVSFCKELNSKQISCACYWESWGESCNIKK